MQLEVRHRFLRNTRFKGEPLAERTDSHFSNKMPNSRESAVLRLQFFWKIASLNKRGIFELQISKHPLFPWLPRVDHRIVELLFGFSEIVPQVFVGDAFFQALDQDFIVHIAIFILFGNNEILKGGLWPCDFDLTADLHCALVVALQDGIVEGSQSCLANDICVTVMCKKILHQLQFVPFGCPHQGSLSRGSPIVDFCMVVLDKQLSDFQIAVEGSPVERGGFVVDGETAVDEVRSFVEKLSDFGKILSLNVPEEVLVGGIAMSDALDSPHVVFLNMQIFYYNLNRFPYIPEKPICITVQHEEIDNFEITNKYPETASGRQEACSGCRSGRNNTPTNASPQPTPLPSSGTAARTSTAK